MSFSDKSPWGGTSLAAKDPLDDVTKLSAEDIDGVTARHGGDAVAAAAEIAEAARRQLASIKLRVERGVRVERATSGKPQKPPSDARPFLSPSEYTEADVQRVIAAARDGEEVAGGVLAAVGRMRQEMWRQRRELDELDAMRADVVSRTLEKHEVSEQDAEVILRSWRAFQPHRWPSQDELVERIEWHRKKTSTSEPHRQPTAGRK